MHAGVQDLVQVVSVGTCRGGGGGGTARSARVLAPGPGTATPSRVPGGQPERRGGKGSHLGALPSLPGQRFPRTLRPALPAAASAICALVFIIPFYCLPPVPSLGRRQQAVLSPEHLCPPAVSLRGADALSSPAAQRGPCPSLPPVLPRPPGGLSWGWVCWLETPRRGGGRPADNAGSGTAVDGGLGNRQGLGNWEVSNH